VTPTAFREGAVEVDGVRLRYTEAGQGTPLVHLHDADGLRLTPAHEVLSCHVHVVAVELPASGPLASIVARAITTLGLQTVNLMATSPAATAALELALQAPERVLALVLEAPAAIRPERHDAELERRLAGLATPTLVLFGTEDTVAAPAMGRVYKALIPNAHLVFVYAAGHAISMDRPAAFAEVVGDFLERHEAFVISRAQTVIHP
jgi:pimeloyl-ACP methyl ester carboxylesterase